MVQRFLFSELFRVKHGFAFQGEYFDSSGRYILVTPGSFNEEGGFKNQGDKRKWYTGDAQDSYILRKDDLIIVMTEQIEGLLGSSALVPESNIYLHNQRIGLIVDINAEKIDKYFLYLLFNTKNVREQLAASASGTKVRHTSPNRIGRVVVDLLPLNCQRRIVDTTYAYDKLIENNLRRMIKLEEAARMLYQEWFVRLRFPGHESRQIMDGLPEGWSKQTLQAVCMPDNGIQTGPFGSQLHQSDYSESGVPVVMPKDIIGFRIVTDSIARIPEELANSLRRHRLQEGDVVYGRRGDIGRRAFISARQTGWFCGTGCLRLRPNPEAIDPRYFFDALGSPETAGTIAGRAKGATMLNLNASVMADVSIIMPEYSLQKSYAKHATQISAMIECLAIQNEKLRTARDLLLPRLMSGEIAA